MNWELFAVFLFSMLGLILGVLARIARAIERLSDGKTKVDAAK